MQSEAMIRHHMNDNTNSQKHDHEEKFLQHCEKGEIGIVRSWLQKEPALVHYRRDLALRKVSKLGHLELVQLLVEFGANIHVKDDVDDNIGMIAHCDAPISHACWENHVPLLRFLLEQHPGPICTNPQLYQTQTNPLLHNMVGRGHLEIIQLLLSHGETFQGQFPFSGVFFGTPTAMLIPMFELLLTPQQRERATKNDWSSLFSNVVGHDAVEAAEWLFQHIPSVKDSVDLQRALSQTLFAEYSYGPHPMMEFLHAHGARFTTESLVDVFNCYQSESDGKKQDRSPLFQFLIDQNFLESVDIKLVESAAIEAEELPVADLLHEMMERK